MALPRGSSMPARAQVRKEQSIKALVQRGAEAKDENELLSQALQDLQAEQTKYEARILGLQRAKQEAIAKADAQGQRASALHLELEKLTIEKTRWQSQERAQHLKGKRLQDRQCEMEDALIDMKREADESAHAAEQAQVEAAELLNNLQVKDMEIAAAEAVRDDALREARDTEERCHHSHSDQSEAWTEERAALLDRVALLEDSLAASQASATAAAESIPRGCGKECEHRKHEVARLRHELQSLLQLFQEQRSELASRQQEIERGRQAVEQLQRQREGRLAAAAALTEGGREARQHSQQAMRWVHRLRTEVLAMEHTLQASHAEKLELVQDKLRLAEALCRATDMLAAERAGDPSAAADQEGDAVRGADDAQAAGTNLHRQLADAAAAEKDMLRRLECEIRRVLELERLRIADLRDNQDIHERLDAEIQTSWNLREALAEHRLNAQQQ